MTATAQTTAKSLAQYFCLYRTARLTYTATLVTYPEREAQLCVITRIVSEVRAAGMVEVGRTCAINGKTCSCDGAISAF